MVCRERVQVDSAASQTGQMKRRPLVLTLAGVAIIVAASVLEPDRYLVWNRSASAPVGLYWLKNDPPHKGRWVVVSAASPMAQWAQKYGYTGPEWPLVKRVAALEGDRVCRFGDRIFINARAVATALFSDRSGRSLPVWSGCIELRKEDVFLLNPHPFSIDGRCFGTVLQSDLTGVAIPLMVSDDVDRDG